VTTFDGRAADHVMKFPRPSPSVFAYCKRSKTGGVEGLGMRLVTSQVLQGLLTHIQRVGTLDHMIGLLYSLDYHKSAG